jgi:YegS/Rv2252/BmrU family lipid kinase
MRCKVIAHPKAFLKEGRGVIHKIRNRLSEYKIDYSVEVGSEEKDTYQIASQVKPDEFDTVITVGGDGTIHKVLNGIYSRRLSFGIIPFGYGNDIARFLGVPKDIDEAIEIIVKGKEKKYYLGEAVSKRTGKKRVFFSVLGMGFDAKVAEAVEASQLKKYFGSFAYTAGALKVLFSFKSPQIKIKYNHSTISERAMMVPVGNTTTYGGGMKATPDADPSKEIFSAVFIRRMGKPAFLWHFPKVFSGKHIKVKKYVFSFNASEIEIDSLPRHKVVADGELYDMLPVKVRKTEKLQKFIIP